MVPVNEIMVALRNVQPDIIVMVNLGGNTEIRLQKLTQLNAAMHPWPRVIEALACVMHTNLDLAIDIGKEAGISKEDAVQQVLNKLQEVMAQGTSQSNEIKRKDPGFGDDIT